MNFNGSPIMETAYLTAQNARQYRMIMRLFFREYEKMHFQLYKEDVLELLHQQEEFENYTMQQLMQDLEALVGWKNLTPLQDPRKVYTIADYKNKQFRYTMSEYAVEVERLTVRLENLFLESGNLSTNLFLRLEENLSEAERIESRSGKEINEWWSNLQEDFKRLNQNYQDYLREFYSGRAEKLLKSVEFIVHKDRFIAYLKEFVQELQIHSSRIAGILDKNAASIETSLLDKVVQSELEIPHTRSEREENREERIREQIFGKWDSLKRWFMPVGGRESESSKVLEITNDIIRNIIQNAALIVQLQNWGVSRKEDYRNMLRMFVNCEDMEEAHRLSAHVFGIQQIEHFRIRDERETDSINRSVYEEPAAGVLLKPHTRAYKERKERGGFSDKSLEKLSQRMEYLKQIEKERTQMLRYVKDGILDVSRIEETVPEAVRITLLRWISQAALNGDGKGRTEYGQVFVLKKREGSCILKCEDGDLRLPAYVLEFIYE
ncbi:MAG: TIGR02677 family protein [Lachnospiraceae bacterium]|nr:TIGR02677 family protein [Lachnospiraceae bacterium]